MQKKWSRLNSQVCPWWLAPTFDNPLRRLIHHPEKILDSLVRPGQVAADIGCGMGYFTIPLARMVGTDGLVLAIDLQEKMLAQVKRRAARAGMLPRIRFHRATPDRMGLAEPVDFALAFWMVHEVPQQAEFLRQVSNILKPQACLLLVEPVVHVTGAAFHRTVETACLLGLKVKERPEIHISRAVLFEKE
jgi:ubiquinone/menaquinone biosynthesis C-methylase UbiE